MRLYLETSSLVKLYASEESSEGVRESIRLARVVATSRVAYAEARAALARKLRERAVSAADHRRAVTDLDRDWEAYLVVDLTDRVARRAGILAERHGLRGFGAIHLSSALAFRDAMASEVTFLTADHKLARAATREGLSTR